MSSGSSSSLASTQKFEARELPIRKVTVYMDRAELVRTFKVTLQQGLNDIVVENVSHSIESDSVRVDGTGAATIHEVQFKTDHVRQDEVDTPQVKELVNELQILKEKSAQIDDIRQIYEKRLNSLNGIIANLGKVALKGDNSSEFFSFDDSAGQALEKLYDFHETKSVDVNSKMRQISHEQENLKDEIRKLQQKINELRSGQSVKRSICITLESSGKESNAVLDLSYQVYQAYWQPSYDARVQTDDKTKFQLFYYGNIQQTSGEDWNDVELLLSTASPRSGGALPKLPTLKAQLVKPTAIRESVHRAQLLGAPMARNQQITLCSDGDVGFGEMESAMPFSLKEAHVEKQVLSTNFTIPQKKTIPSDTSEHKVTIAVLDLSSLLRLDCVPSKDTNVFATATTFNTTKYPILAGTASVYVDNSFSSKVPIKSVATGERFDCPLGVDPLIKVDYKPSHNYQQQVGVINKSAITVHEQKIVVKNTKDEVALITVHENVPKSSDEKIKVKLQMPEVKNGHLSAQPGDVAIPKLPEIGTLIDNNNNLQWTILLGAQEEKELVVKWAVEYPLSETIQYNQD